MKKKQIIMLLSILVVIAGSICFFCFHSRIIDTYIQDNKTMKIYSDGRVAANGFDEKEIIIAATDLASKNKTKSDILFTNTYLIEIKTISVAILE